MLRLNSRDPGFDKAFRRLVRDRRESGEDVARDVARILEDVRVRAVGTGMPLEGSRGTDAQRMCSQSCRPSSTSEPNWPRVKVLRYSGSV